MLRSLLVSEGDTPEAAPLNRGQPLLANPPKTGAELAPVLNRAVRESGLFYEAHQAQWIAGKLPLARLLQEPQGQIPVPAQAQPGQAAQAKQKVFEAYHLLPGLLRTGLIEPLANLPGLSALPPVRKAQSYIRQANTPLPERMESYNFVYRQPLAAMFMPDFLARVDSHQPGALLKEVYERADSDSYINRMLHLDIKFTLADADLRKVTGMTEAAGIDVRYPLLDDAMMDFSGEVPK